MSIILAVDRGNNNLKACIFDAQSRSEVSTSAVKYDNSGKGEDILMIEGMISDRRPDAVAFSSVIPEWTALFLGVLDRTGVKDVFQARHDCRLPFRLLIEKPEMLGADRICAASGAFAAGFREAVIVDAGTAVTVDVLTREGFAGGAIYPGIDLITRSLGSGTAALPGIFVGGEMEKPPGRSTDEAIGRGAFWGMIGALRELIDISAGCVAEGSPVLLTGGSAAVIGRYLDRETVASPGLVLEGLVYLYRINSSR